MMTRPRAELGIHSENYCSLHREEQSHLQTFSTAFELQFIYLDDGLYL